MGRSMTVVDTSSLDTGRSRSVKHRNTARNKNRDKDRCLAQNEMCVHSHNAAACPAVVSWMVKVLPVRILLPSITAA